MGDKESESLMKHISGTLFDTMASNNEFNGKVIKDIFINRDQKQRNYINHYIKDVTFINVYFQYMTITNTTFSNCKFINCRFFDCHLERNKFIDCYFENIVFYNNMEVIGNLFERVSGNVELYMANECNYNVFKDMDFSGFLPIYKFADDSVIWRRNYFINTVISLDRLNEFANEINKVTCDAHNNHYVRFFLSKTPMMYNLVTGDGYPYVFEYPYDRKLPVMRDSDGDFIDNIQIDLSNLTHEAKLNIVASIFTRYQTGHSLDPWFNEELADISFIKHYTVLNPRPAKIVDSRGYILNDGVIQDANFTYTDMQKNGQYYVCDASKLLAGVYNEENSLLNPNNYSCRSLSIRR